MCGIGGILRTDGEPIDRTMLDTMDRRIAHRGPDGAGRFRDRIDRDGRTTEIAFVHRRLAVIDPANGHQPMVWTSGQGLLEASTEIDATCIDAPDLMAIVFNGCIYNHRDLRTQLEASDIRFTTDHSDTEAVMHAYRHWGPAFTDHLEGMYSLAIWDRANAALVLARDWFGEKPLFRRFFDGGVAFCSDALAICGEPEHSPGSAWVSSYLQLGYNWQGATVYAGFEPHGITNHSPTIRTDTGDILPQRPRTETTQAEFERLIEQAVHRRLEADVPLGCFLSGGVDSSLIAHYAKRCKPALHTFTVRMPDERYDESQFAEDVADHLGTNHTTLSVAINPARDLEHLINTLGQPFGDSSILPAYWVSRAARQHVTVALSGDGGDELFFGYDRYMAARHLHRHRRILRWLPERLLLGSHPKSKRYKLGRLGVMARDYPAAGILAMESIFSQRWINRLLSKQPRVIPEQLPGFDPMMSLRRADLLHYLPDDLLCKVDTASMAVALEVRAPFLDRDLVRAAAQTPTWIFAPRGRRKGLLRDIAAKYLPRDVVERPKMGFAIPIGEWFRDDFGGMRTLLTDHLADGLAIPGVQIDTATIRRLMREHLDGICDHGQRLFALLTLAMWTRQQIT